ncbi:MAG: efflux transporter outer membrane subunit [Planctomycetota bacterium]|jgi:NodT family efflux transporter outer membrane factor (OMF) lipoprotein
MTTRQSKVILLLLWTGCVMLLFGCKVGPDYERPDLQLPNNWNQELSGQSGQSADQLHQWWTLLDDPVLDGLIEQVGQANLDVRAAMMRVAESRALRDFTAGRSSPQVDAIGLYSRSRNSGNTRFAFPGIPTDPYDLYAAGFDAGWEIDLFGQIKRSVESSQALLESSIDDYHDVLRSLFAEVARNYVELRTTQARIQYTLQNIEAQEETVKLTEGRFEAGLSPELDVAQAKLNLDNTKAEVPALRLAEIQTINRIAVLLGQYPQSLRTKLKDGKSIPTSVEPGALGLPADLLRRRPDIRRAERELAAQTARVGVATADLYPAFSLTGTFTFQAEDFGDVGRSSSKAYSFGPGLRWHLLSGDRRLRYEQTVLSAVEEVENAMASFIQESKRRISLQSSADESKRSVKLVRELYANGLTDFQNVLDMQRTLWTQQDRLAVSRGQIVLNLIRIYKAVGGGWPLDHPEQERPTEKSDEPKQR